MPGFDRTGPRGQGPRTGWGRGGCHPATGEAVAPRGVGQGGAPWGGGRGCCWGGGRGRRCHAGLGSPWHDTVNAGGVPVPSKREGEE
ncbi:MAG: DUF5320 domain-containing protein [Thermoanaerobaculaceae bacterium]|nr:DUF5320 domain-containing protein [Thermoanaerobaculaceae bacterium]